MANTYHQVYLYYIYADKVRENLIYPSYNDELQKYISHPQFEHAKNKGTISHECLLSRVKTGLKQHIFSEQLQVIHYTISLRQHRSLIFYLPEKIYWNHRSNFQPRKNWNPGTMLQETEFSGFLLDWRC